MMKMSRTQLDKLHAEALEYQAKRNALQVVAAHDTVEAPRYLRLVGAITEAGGYRAALDSLHAEALGGDAIEPGMEVVAHVSGREVTGHVMSTAHRGTELLSIGFYSPGLGHINRIDDAILVHAYDIIGPVKAIGGAA